MSVQRDVTYPLVIQLEHQKELAENEEGAVWSERRVKLANCMEQKRRAQEDMMGKKRKSCIIN